ncbi:MAG TPA: LysR family transcriptional regulator [Novosphingobium sp.]|nr:LysR family transcriptional regulator [Novosphingobium sp.]
MEISLEKIRHLLRVAQTGSFSRAAEELNITQPALSRSIASLEQQFNVRLLDRGRGGATPTAVGRLVLADAQVLVRDADLLAGNMHSYGRGEAGRLSVGVVPLFASLILADVSAAILTARPRLQLRTSVKGRRKLLRELLEHEVEILFSVDGRIASTETLDVVPLGELTVGAFVRAGHPLADRKNLALGDLGQFPYAAANELDLPFPHEPGGALFCDNFETLREVALRSDVVWVSSTSTAVDDLASGRLIRLPVDAPPFGRHRLVLVSLRGRTISPMAHEFIALVRGLLADAI